MPVPTDPRAIKLVTSVLVFSAVVLVVGGIYLLVSGGRGVTGGVLCAAGVFDGVLAFALWQRSG